MINVDWDQVSRVSAAVLVVGTLSFVGSQIVLHLVDKLRARRARIAAGTPLTWVETVEVLKTIQYKPDVTLGWFDVQSGDYWVLTVDALRPDADGKYGDKPVTLKGQYRMKLMPRRELIQKVYHAMVELETHEAAEFFKINGIKVYDPHHRNGTTWL